MNYLVSIAIGPIQEFIASARRTRDLWYGSKLLSEISKAVARAMRQDGVELIFPYADDLERQLLEGSRFTVVNKILGIVDATEQEIGRKAGRWKQVAHNYLVDEFHRSESQIEKSAKIDSELAILQLSSIVELYAAWTQLDSNHYQESRFTVEELLAGRKALRDFPPFEGKPGLRKSSLDGARESVIQARSAERHEIKDAEELDGIGVLKRFGRFGKRGPRFESTHDVAGEPLLVRLETEKAGEVRAFKDFLHKELRLPEGSCAEFLYREKAFDDYEHLKRTLTPKQKEEYESRKRGLLLRVPETPYYAILAGDGDKMGDTIRNITEKGKHQEFSRQLSEFASEAAKIIDSHGEPIYTGGDDVLALLPLHTALHIARQVQDAFGKTFPNAVPEKTFSAGMAVVHAMDSLGDGLRLAHQAERNAKKAGGDSLAVIVAPRSGANVEVVGKWHIIAPMLDEIATLYRKRKPEQPLSKGFAYELRNLLREGWDAMAPPDSPNALDPVLADLALSIARKKEQSASAEELLKHYVLLQWGGPPGPRPAPWPASSPGSEPPAEPPDPETPRQRLDRLTRALLVARFFARAQKEAGL